jgi:hypothetical protein
MRVHGGIIVDASGRSGGAGSDTAFAVRVISLAVAVRAIVIAGAWLAVGPGWSYARDSSRYVELGRSLATTGTFTLAGTFTEIFRESWLDAPKFVQWNAVTSRAGTLRGAHVHRRHADYLVVLAGHLTLGLVDLRPNIGGGRAILEMEATKADRDCHSNRRCAWVPVLGRPRPRVRRQRVLRPGRRTRLPLG